MNKNRLLVLFTLLILMSSFCLPGLAEKKSKTPLLDPQEVKYVRTKDDLLNILFLGLDVTSGDIHASGGKRTVMKSHTDVIMLLTINKTKGRMDLLSIPRDTLCYVPGVHGVYKINAAFNTAKNYKEGFRHIKDTVSWFLGGVKIDAYCAVDLQAMRTLTDKMGGIDYDLEMSYTSKDKKRHYKAGFQHMDGMAIVDYVRARTNATKEADDMGRTKRNRQMMIAIFDKLKSDMNMLNELWAEGQKSTVNFFSDMNGIRVITDMWDFLQGIESAEIGSYMIPGTYEQYILGWWNMNITDQAERIKIIKNLFGINAKELPYVSKDYCRWLLNGGFQATHNIRQARLILDYAKMQKATKDLSAAIKALDSAIDEAVTAFDNASDKLRSAATSKLNTSCAKMQKAAEKVVTLSKYPTSYSWEKSKYWYQDPLINDYPKIDWR